MKTAIADQTLTELGVRLGDALRSIQAQVATAESCTGGGVAEIITRAPGSSAWFELGLVTYSNAQKRQQLGVAEQTLATVGAVSQSVVEAMARGAQALSGARFAIAVSGIAGPTGGSAAKPVGTVWFAWADGEQVCSQCCHFAGSRQEVRLQAAVFAIQHLLTLVAEALPEGA